MNNAVATEQYDTVDYLLARLGGRGRGIANDLLDIKLLTRTNDAPGTCISCYYRVREQIERDDMALLCPLRSWLEKRIEVVARDKEGRQRHLPLQMHFDDLESCCRAYMRVASELLPQGDVELEFAYAPDSCSLHVA